MNNNLLELIKLDASNISFYRKFDLAFEENLRNYQSRIYPNEEAEIVNWYYITVEKRIVGSIWLEKEQSKSYAVLGIFIAEQQDRGKGIGKQAIIRIVEQDAVHMGINEIRLNVRENNKRAFNCYFALGFREISRYKKPNGISAITMGLSIDKHISNPNTYVRSL